MWIPFAVVSVALLGLRVLFALVGGDWSALKAGPGFFLLPVLVSVVLTAWYFQFKSQGGRG